MREIELTPAANKDLEDIWLYGFEKFGMEKADLYIQQISAVFRHIGQYAVGRRREELGRDICSFPCRRHVIFYIESLRVVTIIRVLHHSRDVESHLHSE